MRRRKPTTAEKASTEHAAPSEATETAPVRKRGARRISVPTPPEERELPPVGSIGRTKRLLLAALRVWELKQGIHDHSWSHSGPRPSNSREILPNETGVV